MEWTVGALVERMQAEIAADVARGVVPRGVGSFSELHDYVDANEYGGLCEDACPLAADSDDDTRIINDATHIVDAWLSTGGAR